MVVDAKPLLDGRQNASLLTRAMRQASLVPSAAFLACINDVYAASFGMLLIPVATGVSPSFGVPLYLLSVVAGQLGATLCSDVSFATGGSTYELLPILGPMAELVLSDQTLE